MADLPAFNPAATCPKCGHGDIGAMYLEACVGFIRCDAHPPHMKPRCRQCGYSWDEQPLDWEAPRG